MKAAGLAVGGEQTDLEEQVEGGPLGGDPRVALLDAALGDDLLVEPRCVGPQEVAVVGTETAHPGAPLVDPLRR